MNFKFVSIKSELQDKVSWLCFAVPTADDSLPGTCL